ncbi:MAG: phasin family protein [Acidisphaera sp.]|nr:phasin family protein [Acidisphaera sp.]
MAMDPDNKLTDPARMFAAMKLPSMPDFETLLGAYRRNLEVFSAANRVALEGAQAVAKRNMEIMQQTMSELSENMRAIAATESPQGKAARHADLLKSAYERAVANTKELSDLIQRANTEALGLLNSRVMEAMDEMKALMEKSASEAPR